MDQNPAGLHQESPISNVIQENPDSINLVTSLPSKQNSKTTLWIIISVVILILIILSLIGYIFNNHVKKNINSNINAGLNASNTSSIINSRPTTAFEPTPSPASTPITHFDISGNDIISPAIEHEFNNTLVFLRTQLNKWDPNFIVEDISLYFGTNENDIKAMYKTGVINANSQITVRVYSQSHSSSRQYKGLVNKLAQVGSDSDMSRYEFFKQLSSSDFVPPSPKISVQKCISYANNVGNYYLYDCSNTADRTGNTRFSWMCTFVAAGASSEYSQSFGSTSHVYNCSYDQSQNKVDWYAQQHVAD
jgi:hypothetical protein